MGNKTDFLRLGHILCSHTQQSQDTIMVTQTVASIYSHRYYTSQGLKTTHTPNTNTHLQFIGVNSQELSLTSVLQRIMTSE